MIAYSLENFVERHETQQCATAYKYRGPFHLAQSASSTSVLRLFLRLDHISHTHSLFLTLSFRPPCLPARGSSPFTVTPTCPTSACVAPRRRSRSRSSPRLNARRCAAESSAQDARPLRSTPWTSTPSSSAPALKATFPRASPSAHDPIPPPYPPRPQYLRPSHRLLEHAR